MTVAIEKRFPRNERSPCIAKKVEQSVCFFLTKGAKIIIFNSNLIQKRICRQASMEKFKLKNNYFGTFCAYSRKLKCFFPIYVFLIKVAISVPFCWEALGFSLFVATRFLYVKLLGFFVFWKALVKDSTSAVSRLQSIFSLNHFFIVFNDAIIPLKASGQLLQ